MFWKIEVWKHLLDIWRYRVLEAGKRLGNPNVWQNIDLEKLKQRISAIASRLEVVVSKLELQDNSSTPVNRK